MFVKFIVDESCPHDLLVVCASGVVVKLVANPFFIRYLVSCSCPDNCHAILYFQF